MNAHSIKEYILKLEKENMALREELETVKSTDGQYAEWSDDEESVTSTECTNIELAHRFYEKAAGEEHPHKKHVYTRVGDIIRDLPFEVTCGEDVEHLRGIGKKSVRLIDKWLNVC